MHNKIRNPWCCTLLAVVAYMCTSCRNKHTKECVYFFKDGMRNCPCAMDPLWSVTNSILEPDEREFFRLQLNQVWVDMPALSLGAVTSNAESVFDTMSNDIPKNREKTFQFGLRSRRYNTCPWQERECLARSEVAIASFQKKFKLCWSLPLISKPRHCSNASLYFWSSLYNYPRTPRSCPEINWWWFCH